MDLKIDRAYKTRRFELGIWPEIGPDEEGFAVFGRTRSVFHEPFRESLYSLTESLSTVISPFKIRLKALVSDHPVGPVVRHRQGQDILPALEIVGYVSLVRRIPKHSGFLAIDADLDQVV